MIALCATCRVNFIQPVNLSFLITVVHALYGALFFLSSLGQWMDYMCRVGSLGNSSTAYGSIDHGVTVGPSCMYCHFYRVRRTPFHIFTTLFLPSSSVSFFLFNFCCTHAQVFGKALMHEFRISCSHTGRCFLFFEKKAKVKSSMARSLPVENLLPQNVG